jgi:16S rRNA (guanine527-N7)-methyltransferase
MNNEIGNKYHLADRLSIACDAMGICISAEQQRQLLAYLDQLLRWNKTYNLTAIRDPEQGLIQHIFDSLSVVVPLTQYLQQNAIQAPIIADVGSGGGLPGVVLAIVLKQAKIMCIDTVEKKTSFIRQAASVLTLDNLKALHSRVENIEPLNADIVISRAFASLEDFANLAGKHVAPNRKLIGMKGKHPAQEGTALLQKGEWDIEKIEPLNVPELGAERCLVWMQRKGQI